MARRSIKNDNTYEKQRVRGGTKYRLTSQTSKSRSFSRGRLTISSKQTTFDKQGNSLGSKESNFSFNVFSLVFIVLLGVAVFSFLNQSEVKTFASFLEMLSNVPDVSAIIIGWVKTASSYLTTNIPVLDFIIRLGTGGLSMVIILLTGLVQAFIFILNIFAWVIV